MGKLKTNTISHIGILSPMNRKIMWKWLNGWSLLEIGRKHNLSTGKVVKLIEKSIDKIDAYCYNKERYISIFGHLFDEWAKNRRRSNPYLSYDDKWGLTHREVWLLRMWKVDAKTTGSMCRSLRIKENTLNQYKSVISGKVGINEIERRDFGGSWDNGSFSSGFELSSF